MGSKLARLLQAEVFDSAACQRILGSRVRIVGQATLLASEPDRPESVA